MTFHFVDYILKQILVNLITTIRAIVLQIELMIKEQYDMMDIECLHQVEDSNSYFIKNNQKT